MKALKNHRPAHLIVGPRGQRGFIQAVLLFGIALMTAVLGGFALANRSPSSQTDVEQAKVNASVVLKQASDLRDGVSRYSSDFGASSVLATMDFSLTSQVGLFDPAARYASPQVMPRSAFPGTAAIPIVTPVAGKAGHWHLNKKTPANAVGSATEDPMAILPDLRQDVCARINYLLYGDLAIPAGTGALSAWQNNTGDGGISGVSQLSGWAEGCVATSDAKYVYFKVIQEN